MLKIKRDLTIFLRQAIFFIKVINFGYSDISASETLKKIKKEKIVMSEGKVIEENMDISEVETEERYSQPVAEALI